MEPHTTIGIAGHVDHGKTTLVRSLAGVDTDRLEEEKRRGLSIECGVAPLDLPSGKRVALVDVPGQPRFLKNTIRGLACVDMAILVVAADDGVMPQTLEHLDLLGFLQIKSGFVVLGKSDLVDGETLDLAEMEIQEAVVGSFLEGKGIVRFSSQDRRGLEEIKRRIELEMERLKGRACDGPFRLWIDQLRTIQGFGTVVTGTVLSGSVRQDDRLCILPSGRETRARFLEVHHRRVSEAVAGQRVGINLHRVPIEELCRGMLLCRPGAFAATPLLNVELQVRGRATAPIKNRQKIRLHVGTAVSNAMIVLMETDRLEPGESGLAQLRLLKPVAALPGDPLVFSLLNVPSPIAGGKVLEVPSEKYRPAKAARTIPYLKTIQNGDVAGILDGFFARRLSGPVTAADVAMHMGLDPGVVEAEIGKRIREGDLLAFDGLGVYGRSAYETLKERVLAIAEKVLSENPFQKTILPEEIKSRIAPPVHDKVLEQALTELCREGTLVKVEGAFRLPRVSVRLSREQERLVSLLLEYGRELGLVPFRADMFWKFHHQRFNKNEIQRLMDYLHEQNRLIRLENDRFLTPEALEQIKDGVRRVIGQKGCLTLADTKEVLGYGRTVGMLVLEHLDAIGFTRREGNARVLAG